MRKVSDGTDPDFIAVPLYWWPRNSKNFTCFNQNYPTAEECGDEIGTEIDRQTDTPLQLTMVRNGFCDNQTRSTHKLLDSKAEMLYLVWLTLTLLIWAEYHLSTGCENSIWKCVLNLEIQMLVFTFWVIK